MTITAEKMAAWCRGILGDNPDVPKLPLEQYLPAIPRLESLAVPPGTPVLVRGDVDAKPGAKVGDGDIRLRSMKDTLDYGRQKGWKQIVFGHVGREPEKSLAKVRDRLAAILACEVTFIADWLDPATLTIPDAVAATIRAAAPGSVLMLQNTRKYDIERVLWKAKPADCPKLAERLAAGRTGLRSSRATACCWKAAKPFPATSWFAPRVRRKRRSPSRPTGTARPPSAAAIPTASACSTASTSRSGTCTCSVPG